MADYVVPDETHLSHRGALGNMPTPYKGTAPAPRQATPEMHEALGIQNELSIDLAGSPSIAHGQIQPSPTQVFSTDMRPSQLGATPLPGQEAPQMQVSPPPSNPSQASELASLRSEVGRLVQALGTREAESQQRMAEMQFSLEAAQVPRTPAPQAFALPPGINPDVAPTWEQLNGVLSYLVPAVQANAQAQAIRTNWGVTPDEETAAFNRFPVLSTIQSEPARTQKILEAVRLLRTAKGAPASSLPASAQALTPPLQTRPSAPTVPHTEFTSAPVQYDTPGPSGLDAAMAEYRAVEASIRTARNDAERKERLAALRQATERLKSLQGITDEMERTTPFRTRS